MCWFLILHKFLFQITQAELVTLLTNMGKVDAMAASGIKLGGEKYM
jgi:hypothetical protein